MITAVTIDGVLVNNEYTYLSSVRDSVAAQSEIRSYSRGGRNGVVLGNPFYRGFVLSLEWTVIGNTYEKLVEQRDRLARFFRLSPNKSGLQSKILGFTLADGSVRQIPAFFSPYVGSISPQDTTKTTIQVTCQTELEYFVSSEDFSAEIGVQNLGGFSVPFDVPFDMSKLDDDSYSEAAGNIIVINNRGNAEYYPTLKIEGPLDQISVINDTVNQHIEYAGELQGGDELVIDMYERTAILNGITNVLADVSGDWWYLDPGNNSIRLLAGAGNGSAKICYRYAYRGI